MPGPGQTALILGLAAIAMSLLLKAAFDAWVSERYLFWDDNAIGMTPYVWASVTPIAIGILALASVVVGRLRSILGIAGIGLVAVLWALVVDNALGALRDGAVSAQGLVIGGLAIALVGVLSVWLAFVWRWARMTR